MYPWVPIPPLALFQRSLTPGLLVYMQHGATPLHFTKIAEVAKALMDAKADIDAQDSVSAYAVVDVCESVCISV